MLLNGPDELSLVEKEVSFMQRLHHPNLLPLLDVSFQKTEDSMVTTAYMLFPLYEVSKDSRRMLEGKV